MERPSRIALILASFYAAKAALDMIVWWAARLDYLAAVSARESIAAFAPAMPWYFVGAAIGNHRGHGTAIAMAAWAAGLALNTWLIFLTSRYVGRRIRLSWVRAV